MASGSAVMSRWIEGFRKLPKEATAEAIVDVVEEDVRSTISAGTTPDGVPWPERKVGGKALKNANGAVTVAAIDTKVIVRLTGPEAVHHFGTKKDPQRQVIPTAIRPTLATRIKNRLFERFRKVLGVG